MKKKSLRTLLCLILAGTMLAAFVAVAADVGSQGDPLVTLSYLSEVFMGQMTEKMDEKLAGRNDTMRAQLQDTIARKEQEILGRLGGNSADSEGGLAVTYMQVDLAAGQTLYGSAGCEVMLRSGSAKCVASGTPGLLDTTDGTSINNGSALKQNHLYMMTADRGVKAGNDVTLLVRGSYTIG